MNADPNRQEPDVAQRNVERLIAAAYRPESPDAAFLDRAAQAMRAAADRRAEAARAARRQSRRLLARVVAWTAAAVLLLGLGAAIGWRMGPRGDKSGAVADRPAPSTPEGSRPEQASHESGDDSARLPPRAGLTAQARPAVSPAEKLATGQSLATGAGERRRVALPDGSTLFVQENTALVLEADRQLRLRRGEVFCEVAPRPGAKEPQGASFVVQTPDRRVAALGTRFQVRHGDNGTGVLVTQGKVQVSGMDAPLVAGQQLVAGPPDAGPGAVLPAPRASYALDWTRELLADARRPLVPPSRYAGGALVARDPSGRESRLSLRKLHVDVHIEDGFARTTIDQTYFNHEPQRLEGTFFFPLPADASLSRLAMYVDGRLMEGGMAERRHAREVYESIVRSMKDPALLEWIDGSTFRMRVFPLEGRQEKRIILSYTQRLPSLYGRAEYRFPAGHSLEEIGRWSSHVVVKGGAAAAWRCPSHAMKAAEHGGDLALDASAERVKADRDLVLTLESVRRGSPTPPEPPTEGLPSPSATGDAARFSSAEHEGARYLMLRWRPDLKAENRPERRDWIVLFESSADRDPLLARVQADVVRTILENAERDDTVRVVAAGARARALGEEKGDSPHLPERPATNLRSVPGFAQMGTVPFFRPLAPENVEAAVRLMENTQLIGALDLEQGFAEAARLAGGAEKPVVLHVGSGLPVLGERDVKTLVDRLPQGACYVGVGVGKRWNRTLMKAAAARTGGFCTQINPDEDVAWRAFDLLATLNTPRLADVKVVDRAERAAFLAWNDWLAQGEELCAITRLAASQPMPDEIEITGRLDGKPFVLKLAVRDVAAKADYLPRTWAKLEIDRLVADGAQKHHDEIVPLSKAMYVMSPFTSLLVLENEEMYRQYGVDRGRKDHWAMYPCPETIPVVTEPFSTPGPASQAAEKPGPKKPSAEEVLRTIVWRTPPRLLVVPRGRDGRAPGGVPVAGFVSLGWSSAPIPGWGATNEDYDAVDSWNMHSAVPVPAAVRWDALTRQYFRRLDGRDDPSGLADLVNAVKDTYMEEVVGPDPEGYLRRKWHLEQINYGKAGQSWPSSPFFGTRVYPVADLVLPIRVRESGNGSADFDSLIDLITSTIRPTTWEDVGGPGRIAPFETDLSLVVSQTQDPRVEYLDDLDVVVIRGQRTHDVVRLIRAVERDMPFPDQPPFVYPDADVWARLTAHRKELYRGMDLASRGVAERKIADELGMPTVLEFVETPLQDVIDYLKDFHGIEIQIDKKALDDVGIGTDTPVTKNLKGISLRSALRLLLRDLDLTYVIEDEVLLITTPEEAEARLNTLVTRASRRPWLAQNPFEGQPRYWLPQFNDDRSVFTDLVAYAPGMNTSLADVRAVLESEAEPRAGLLAGRVDPGARRLIESARNAAWQTATLRDARGRTVLAIDFDGTGRYRYGRTTRHGLREEVVCDGRQLWRLYPELGVGARREVSRFHRAELAAMIPWALPPANDLAWGADVALVDEHTVAIVPHSSPLPAGDGQGVRAARGPGVPSTDGAAKPELGNEKACALHLVFAPDGRLASRRLVKTPSGETLLGETYAADGTVTLRDAEGKALGERKIELAACGLPELRPDVREMVVLPMPLRTRDHVLAERGLDPKKGCEAWSEDDALAVIAADMDEGGADMQRVIGRRFFHKGDRRLGFYTLLLGAAVKWDIEKELDLGEGVRVRFDPLADHPGDPLAEYVAAWARLPAGKKQVPAGSIGGPQEGFLQQMLRVEKLRDECRQAAASGASGPPMLPRAGEKPQPVAPDRLGLCRRGLEMVRACTAPELAWGVVTAMAACAENDAQRRLVAEAATALEDSRLRFAAMYRRAVSLDFGAERRDLLTTLVAETAAAGLRPPIDGDMRHWVLHGVQGGQQSWRDLVRSASAKLVALDARPAVVAMAYDLNRSGDPDLAGEALEAATRDAPEAEAPTLKLLVVRYFWHTGQRDRAQSAVDKMLEDERLGRVAWLWGLAAQVAEERGDPARAIRCRERALDLAYADPPKDLPLESLRADHQRMLDRYRGLAKALRAAGADAPPEFLARVVAVADRWRSLDPEPQEPCRAAASILGDLGAAGLAWDYATTPLASKPDEPPGWSPLAAWLRAEGLFELADRAFALAIAAEPANAQLVWDRAQVLLEQGRRGEAEKLLRRVAEGDWPPQFGPLKDQARQRLEKR